MGYNIPAKRPKFEVAMFIIVGLGNPGAEYLFTRHNIGFMFLDYSAGTLNFSGFKSKFESLYSDRTIDLNCLIGSPTKGQAPQGTSPTAIANHPSERIILQKPQTFMNLSGRAVGQLVSFYKIDTKNVIVVHDDIDLEPLDVRIKFGGSNGGHNGLRSIDGTIGKEYWRIRIGVGRPPLKEQVADYVLSSFSKDELKSLPSLFESILGKLPELLSPK
jgi:PTH1 family peptidyl-tRNA hydrolase